MARYAKRDLMSVKPFIGTTLKYGFLTNVKESIRTELGQVRVDRTQAATTTGLVIGANAPKPARASKYEVASQGTVSSFVDAVRVSRLPSGWTVGRPKVRRGSQSPKTHAVYVTIRGIKYAWRIPKETWVKIGGAAAALGIKLATSNDKDLVFGASFPTPPKVGKIMTSGNGGLDHISTFCDPSKVDNLPAGWSTIRDSGEEL